MKVAMAAIGICLGLLWYNRGYVIDVTPLTVPARHALDLREPATTNALAVIEAFRDWRARLGSAGGALVMTQQMLDDPWCAAFARYAEVGSGLSPRSPTGLGFIDSAEHQRHIEADCEHPTVRRVYAALRP